MIWGLQSHFLITPLHPTFFIFVVLFVRQLIQHHDNGHHSDSTEETSNPDILKHQVKMQREKQRASIDLI